MPVHTERERRVGMTSLGLHALHRPAGPDPRRDRPMPEVMEADLVEPGRAARVLPRRVGAWRKRGTTGRLRGWAK
jgi:hypothetical protein